MLVLERLQGTGRLTTKTAKEMQVVGVVGRASGIDADARRDARFPPYDSLTVRSSAYDTGDVWARSVVRIDEARESVRLTLLENLPAGDLQAPLGDLSAGAHATVIVEAWRGPIWY
jgi:Ni,Fe-hydrogenase III large subunit